MQKNAANATSQPPPKSWTPSRITHSTKRLGLLKSFPPRKFDQTVTLAFRLGVDPKQSDQMVRGTCPLPHGTGKTVRVLVFAQGAGR